MKNFKGLVILILTLFYILQIQGIETHDLKRTDTRAVDIEENNVVKQVNNFFNQLQKHPEYFSKKVLLDNHEVSIIDQLKSSNEDSKRGSWPVTKENVNTLLHLINIVISCEYSEITYHYIKLIDKCFSPCTMNKVDVKWYNFKKKNKLNRTLEKCFEDCNSNLFNNFLEHIPPMIFSLAHFVKFTKNVVFKYHDILRILLSWYAYIVQNGNTTINIKGDYDKSMPCLETMILINVQMKNRLERFIVKNCYRLETLSTFQKQVDCKISDLGVSVPYVEFFHDKFDKIKSLTYPNFDDIKNKYVIYSSDSNVDDLIKIIYNEVSYGKINVNWDKNKYALEDIFSFKVKNSINIRTMLQYEKLLVNIIIEIIVRHEIKVLRKIINDNTSNRTDDCNTFLGTIIEFVQKIEAVDDQPIGLIDDLLSIITDLSFICDKIENYNNIDINDTVDKLSMALKNNYLSKFTGSTDISKFLNPLSKMVICVKLHPMISNTFLKQLSIYSVPEFEHLAVNYQNLHTMYNKKVDNDLCLETVKVHEKIEESIEKRLKSCIRNDEKNNLESTENYCLTEFNKEYNQVIIDIANITANTIPEYFVDWAKMLLTLYFNGKNVDLFNGLGKPHTINATNIQDLRTFIYIVKNVLLENQYIKCSCGLLSDSKIGHCSQNKNNRRRKEYINDTKQLRGIRGLDAVYKFEDLFRDIGRRVNTLLNEFRSFTLEFKLYWDGTEKKLDEVQASYQTNTFDIQDGYDYASFYIKWVISIAYSRLIDIFYFVISNKLTVSEDELAKLAKNIENILKIELPKCKPIGLLLRHFISALQELDHDDVNSNINIINDLRHKFEFLGFIEKPLLESNRNISDLIEVFSMETNQLMVVFNVK